MLNSRSFGCGLVNHRSVSVTIFRNLVQSCGINKIIHFVGFYGEPLINKTVFYWWKVNQIKTRIILFLRPIINFSVNVLAAAQLMHTWINVVLRYRKWCYLVYSIQWTYNKRVDVLILLVDSVSSGYYFGGRSVLLMTSLCTEAYKIFLMGRGGLVSFKFPALTRKP